MWRCCTAVVIFLLIVSGCRAPEPPARRFPLTGEIVAIKADRTEVTVKHDDIKDFMPPMTMPFPIKEAAQLTGLAVGDTIAATLVLTNEESFLTDMRKTGTVPPEQRSRFEERPASLAPGQTVPDFTFTADDGRPVALASLRGSFVLLTFIYTRCPLPDYCPRMNASFKGVQDRVLARPDLQGQVQLLSVSFDPDFDTPARLKAQAASAGAVPALWRFVTAPRPGIDEFGARFGLTVTREGADGTNITHNLRTALLARDGTLVKTYNGSEWSPAEVLTDLDTLTARR
jgi:protein SCO1/2